MRGTASGNTISYQWQRDGANIPGATASTYKLTKDDEGVRVRVLVTASNVDGTVERASDASIAPISPFPPANVAAPVITGTPQRSRTLSAIARDLDRAGQHVRLPVAAGLRRGLRGHRRRHRRGATP